jgi:hypothetical protein
MKLEIELIPSTSWGRNCRSIFSEGDWQLLRKFYFNNRSNKCEICGGNEKLHLHEVFGYNNSTATQTLLSLQILCYNCHLCKHLGMANILGKTSQAFDHLMDINDLTYEQVLIIRKYAFDLWHERNEITWSVNLDYAVKQLKTIKEKEIK